MHILFLIGTSKKKCNYSCIIMCHAILTAEDPQIKKKTAEILTQNFVSSNLNIIFIHTYSPLHPN